MNMPPITGILATTLILLVTTGGLLAYSGKNLPGEFPVSANLSFTVRNSETGKLVVDVNSQKNTLPASTQKIVITWASLALLGQDKKWTTDFEYTGSIQQGILMGDLVIRGSGDPAFGSTKFGSRYLPETIFKKWFGDLKKLGIKRISGCVVPQSGFADDGLPNRFANFEDVGNYYAGTTSGLCYRDNQYTLHLQGSGIAGLPIGFLGTEPEHTGIQTFENFLTTGPVGSADLAYIFGSPISEKRILRGTYPAGKKKISIKGSLPHPAYTFAREFSDFLISRGIKFENKSDCNSIPSEAGKPMETERSFTKISAHQSPTLASLCQYILRSSNNNYSDQLLVLLGREKGKVASRREGLAVLSQYLVKSKLPPAEFHFKDGSGLSRKNWVSGNFMTGLLQLASRSVHFENFKKSFTGGTPGQTKKLQRYGPGWSEKLWIKTGYLEGISTFTGYFKAKSGTLYSFFFSLNFADRPDDIRVRVGRILKETADGL